jgi:hypothetical protein
LFTGSGMWQEHWQGMWQLQLQLEVTESAQLLPFSL